MKSHRRSTALAALALCAAGLLPSAQAAAAADTVMPADAKKVILSLERTGKLTAAGRAVLKKYPELAAITRDPSQSTVEVTEDIIEPITAQQAEGLGLTPSPETVGTAASSTMVAAAAAYCRSVTVTKREASTLGATLYRFNHAMKWCYTLNGTVHEVPVRMHYLSDVSFTAEWQGLIQNTFYGLRTSRVSSYLQGHFKHCYPQLGCPANSYPSVNIVGRSDGSYSYVTAG